MELHLDADELRTIVREVVREELAGSEDDPLLSRAEAADYLRCSEQRISDLTSQGRVRRSGQKGTKYVVRRSELERFLSDRSRS
jgi:excisionase family DNA binding protein